MTYRQVIANNGVSFALTMPGRVVARDEMTDTEFDSIMKKGFMQAKADNSKEAKEVFTELRKRI